MRKIVLALATVFSMFCLVACNGETQNDVSTGSKEEVVMGNAGDEPTTKPVVEATAEPTEEPSSEVAEATAEPTPTEETVAEVTAEPIPTEEPALYPGIDMESDLPGAEWIETFVGIIDEPKVVVYSDITGRKEIIEEKDIVLINPDEDIIAIYLPEGYVFGGSVVGIKVEEMASVKHSESFFLDPERTREKKYETAGLSFMENGEEKYIMFSIESQ